MRVPAAIKTARAQRPSAAAIGHRPSARATAGGALPGRPGAVLIAGLRSCRFGNGLASHRAAITCASLCQLGCARRAAARTAYRVSSAPLVTSALHWRSISARGTLGTALSTVGLLRACRTSARLRACRTVASGCWTRPCGDQGGGSVLYEGNEWLGERTAPARVRAEPAGSEGAPPRCPSVHRREGSNSAGLRALGRAGSTCAGRADRRRHRVSARPRLQRGRRTSSRGRAAPPRRRDDPQRSQRNRVASRARCFSVHRAAQHCG